MHLAPPRLSARQRENIARHGLLNPERVVELWWQRQWEHLAVVSDYARAGVPVEMSRSDPFMYRKLSGALCEYHVRGLDQLNPVTLGRLARNPLSQDGKRMETTSPEKAPPTAGLSREQWMDRLAAIGDHLQAAGATASLVAFGSVPNVLGGQPERTTMDLDIWRPASEFREAELRAAVEAAGLLYDPKQALEPDQPYVQIVGPGIVQLGKFEPVPTARMGGLTLAQPPVENLIASKLCRANPRDLQDIAWMTAQQWPDLDTVTRLIKGFSSASRAAAKENMVYLEVLAPPAAPAVPAPAEEEEDAPSARM